MELTDRYLRQDGVVYLTGIQALVRLAIDQMRRDQRAGLHTACLISGYEGSPLGGFDLALGRVADLLRQHRIDLVPGLNEEIAATAIFGAQRIEAAGPAKVDGVVGIWYGKGPGVDRSGDALRHANFAGAWRQGAALVLAGDDHAAKSSTIPHQSDLSFFNLGMPVLAPGSTQEVLDYGLYAIALSRFSGAWVGMKLVTAVCDGGGTVAVDPDVPRFRLPDAYDKRTDGRLLPPYSLRLENEVLGRRLEAAKDFSRLNPVNRCRGAAESAWLGIASAGKAYYDLIEALRDLGIGEEELRRLGIRLAKFGMTFPLEESFVRQFAAGLATLVVVEEKRSFLEFQIRDILYDAPERPKVIGKRDEHGAPLFPATLELDPDMIAQALGPRIAERNSSSSVRVSIGERLAFLETVASRPGPNVPARRPDYCPGCPHNRSTLLLEGQVALGGIGCHGMGAAFTDPARNNVLLTQMGGEGAAWIGMAPYVTRDHIFQNLGDGTWAHSGSLGIRACVAAGVNITFKILYNGHVAMTGGQQIVGNLSVADLTRQLEAEGVRKTVIVAEETRSYRDRSRLARNVEIRARSDLKDVLRRLEREPGVTALIYDQQCAAEKRRARSRGKAPEPLERLVIQEEVCEGCGDCVRESNCLSLQPVMTEFGEKMRIHQPSCNKDYTCAFGDCPSFVSVRLKPGTGLRKPPVPHLPETEAPEPGRKPVAAEAWRIVSAGLGGTGVITVNALLATAASIEGLHVVTLDETGLAQKGGAVVSHLTLSRRLDDFPARINAGKADLILGFDLLGAAHPRNLKCAGPERTAAVLNANVAPHAAAPVPQDLLDRVASWARPDPIAVPATALAEALFGSHLAANIFLLGVAYQAGLVPLAAEAIEAAIRLNGVAVEQNLQAWRWGRKYHEDRAWVESHVQPETLKAPADPVDLCVAELTAYQNAAYARQYREFVSRVGRQAPSLRDVVARNLYKLMAYKDEYEVARLLTKPAFERRLAEQWEAVQSVSYHLHPPLLRALGLKRKLKLGSWFRLPLRVLAACKFLRGTPADLFGYTAHRRQERELIRWYRDLVEQAIAMAGSDPDRALEIAALPEQIRGYGDIKAKSVAQARQRGAMETS